MFDVAVIDDTGGLMGTMGQADRGAAVRELLRVLRPGGRVVIIGTTPRTGMSALLKRAEPASALAAGDAVAALTADGFKFVRTLAEREGLMFIEGIKPR
jgi:ubiquinone/menaquinone biosynthesis C-methylase UbiE